MSGLYIPNFEMPKCCYDCELIDIVKSCPHYETPLEAYCQIPWIRKTRSQDCPLVPVPDHGRLVDADDVFHVLTSYYHHSTDFQHEALKEALARVSTIIPADKGDGT